MLSIIHNLYYAYWHVYIYVYLHVDIPYLYLLKVYVITINKSLGGKVLQSITFLWPFGKNLVNKFNPQ